MDYVFANYPMLLAVTVRHLEICLWSVGLALGLGIPLGVLSAKLRWLAPIALGAVSIIYTVPSLAMFGLMIPVLGIGLVPAVVAIGLYSLLPVVQNTFTGIVTVDRNIREAAVGMGMGRGKILFAVEMPLAAPVIFAGIRTAVVSAVGMATLASLIGAGGLGDVIFRGISSVSLVVVLAGSVPVIALALLADFALKRAEGRLSMALGEARA
jgi:osmoprotectant transport system permease protein